MSLTHGITQVYVTGEGNVATGSLSVTGDSEANIDVTLAVNDSGLKVPWTVSKADMKSLLMFATQNVVVRQNTIGGAEIDLLANIPVAWDSSTPYANPLNDDTTALFLTNSGIAAADVHIRCLLKLLQLYRTVSITEALTLGETVGIVKI